MCRTSVGRKRHVSDSTLRQIAQLNKLSFSGLRALEKHGIPETGR